MRKIALTVPLALALAACVSDQEYQAQLAACERPGETHLAIAKCQNAAMYSSRGSQDRDLQEVMAATREAVAAKLDRHEITEEDARLQVAQAKAQLTGEHERRDLDRAAIIAAAATPAPAPFVAPQVPRPVNCTSTGFGATVTTHCF